MTDLSARQKDAADLAKLAVAADQNKQTELAIFYYMVISMRC